MSNVVLSHVCIYVSDVYESSKFYLDFLNLEPSERQLELLSKPDLKFFPIKLENIILGIEPGGVQSKILKTKAQNPVLLQFKVISKTELEHITHRLEELKVTFVEKMASKSYGILTSFIDLDGNKLEYLFEI